MAKKKSPKITILPDGSCFAVVRMDKVNDFMDTLFDPQVRMKRKKTKSKSKNEKTRKHKN